MVKKKYVLSLFVVLVVLGIVAFTLSSVLMAAESPEIISFKSSSTTVTLGDSFTLDWEVVGAKSIEITGPEKIPDILFPQKYQFEVWPTKTKKYSIIAHASDGSSVSEELVVEVVDNSTTVAIDDFKATSSQVESGSNVELTWDVRNEESVVITDSQGNEVKFSAKTSG